ncbi:MAG: hypothetical protein IT256_07650, partial [Chitinophagaceae bacterium]|nr:hypothetical protein [Chitinophagaceae bacterium]
QKFWTQLFVFAAIGTIGFPVFILTYSPANAVKIISNLSTRSIGIYFGLLSILGAGFAYLQSPQIGAVFINSILLLVLFIGIIMADALLIVFKSFKAIISINAIYALLFCLIHIFIINKDFQLSTLIAAISILSFGRLLVGFLFIKKQYRAHSLRTEDTENIDSDKTRKLWVQLGINELITQMFRWADKFVLSFIISQELFAIYFNGSTEFQFLAILFSAVSSAAVQHWAHHHVAETAQNKIPLLHYSARILSSIMFPLFFFFMFYRAAFLTVVFAPSYLAAVWIFVCAQLVLPLRAYPFTALLQSEHRGDIINKGAIIDFIIAVVLMYPMYLWIGLPGVALSFVVSTYWQAGYYLWHSAQISNLPIKALIPYTILVRKFFIFAIIIGLSFAVAQYIFDSPIPIFATGATVLIFSSCISLWYEWQYQKKSTI